MKEKILQLYEFLDADMPTKIFPDEWMKKNEWERKDMFKNIDEVREYLRLHFKVAFPEIKEFSK